MHKFHYTFVLLGPLKSALRGSLGTIKEDSPQGDPLSPTKMTPPRGSSKGDHSPQKRTLLQKALPPKNPCQDINEKISRLF